MVGGAYSQDRFSSKVQFTGGDYTLGSADVLMDYTLKTTADVTPSNRGLDLSLGKLAFNMAIAKNTAYAGSDLEFSIPKNSNKVKGDIRVRTLGSDEVEAKVQTAKVSVSGLSLGANVAKADLSATQSAVLRVGGTLHAYGDLTVESLARTATANANVGANTLDSTGVKVSLASADVSKAIANENLTNTAALVGAAYGTEERDALVDMGDYEVRTVTETDYEIIESVTYTLKNGGGSITTSESEEKVREQLARILRTKLQNVSERLKTTRIGGIKLKASMNDAVLNNFYNTMLKNDSDINVVFKMIKNIENTNYVPNVIRRLLTYTNTELSSVADSIDIRIGTTNKDNDVWGWEETLNYGTKMGA